MRVGLSWSLSTRVTTALVLAGLLAWNASDAQEHRAAQRHAGSSEQRTIEWAEQPPRAPIDISGTLKNGTPFSIHVPSNWRGVLIMDADLPDHSHASYRWMHSQGYATAGKSRNVTDWRVADGSADLIELKNLFIQRVQQPATTIVWGRSLGGLVTRDVIEAYPGHFDAAIPMCGGGAGMVGMWNNRLDALFALKALIAPDNAAFEIVNITDEKAAIAALHAAVDLALATQHGRARMALAAAIGQIDGWPTHMTEPPARADTEAAVQAIAAAYRSMLFSRKAIEVAAGGNISWNVGIDYRKVFDQASPVQRQLVRDLYAAIGEDYRMDLRSIERAPRIKAKRAAVAWAIENATHEGRLDLPVLSVFTAVDPRGAVSELNAYDITVKRAGHKRLLRQAVVSVSGHCAFRDSEQAAVIDAALAALRDGQWRSIATAQDLNARAARLIAASNGILTMPSRFIEPKIAARFPRPFIAGRDSIPRGALE